MDQKIIFSILLLSSNLFNISCQDKDLKNNKMLIRYVKNGIYLKVKELLDSKANVNIKDNASRSLTELTTDPEILKLLDEYKELSDKSLINAVRENKISKAKTMLKSKSYNELSNSNGVSALMFAAEEGSVDMVTLLLKYERDLLNKQDNNGLTALMVAIQYGQEKIVDILLEKKPDIDLKTKNSDTAFKIAEAQFKTASRIKCSKNQKIYKNIMDKLLLYDPGIILRTKQIKVLEPESKSSEDEGFELINSSEYIDGTQDDFWVKV